MSNLPHDHGQKIEEWYSQLPTTEDFGNVSRLLHQLSDGSRLKLFWILCHCEECVINLSAMMDMSSPALSHHLKLLKNAALIVSRRDGKEVYYKASQTQQAKLLHTMIETLLSLTCPEEGCQFHDA